MKRVVGGVAWKSASAAARSRGAIDASTLIGLLQSTPGVPDVTPVLKAYKARQFDKTQLMSKLREQVGVDALRAAQRRAAAEPPCIDDLYGEVTRVCGLAYENCTNVQPLGDLHFTATYANHQLASAVAASIRACAPSARRAMSDKA